MKILKIVGPLAVLLLVFLLFAARIGPMPGVLIGGKPSEVPDSWGDTSNIHEMTLLWSYSTPFDYSPNAHLQSRGQTFFMATTPHL